MAGLCLSLSRLSLLWRLELLPECCDFAEERSQLPGYLLLCEHRDGLAGVSACKNDLLRFVLVGALLRDALLLELLGGDSGQRLRCQARVQFASEVGCNCFEREGVVCLR